MQIKFEQATLLHSSLTKSQVNSPMTSKINSQSYFKSIPDTRHNIHNSSNRFSSPGNMNKNQSNVKSHQKIFSDRILQQPNQQPQGIDTYQFQNYYDNQKDNVSFTGVKMNNIAEQSLVEFHKSALKSKYERYYEVNGQIIKHLSQLKEIENQNTLQAQEIDILKEGQHLLLQMLKSIDIQTLQKQITEIGEFIENGQKGKDQKHCKSQAISEMKMIISSSIEHGNHKLMLLIEDEDKDIQSFTEAYQQVLSLGLQLQPKEKVLSNIKKYNIPKEAWYDYISNQTF